MPRVRSAAARRSAADFAALVAGAIPGGYLRYETLAKKSLIATGGHTKFRRPLRKPPGFPYEAIRFGGILLLHESTVEGGGSAVLDATDVTTAMRRLDDLLDLSNVRMKLADTDEGPGLGAEEIELMEAEYRKFLALQLMRPGAVIVPCKIVDEVWHRHILDTAAYREDCEALFGRFLDHYPYFGMRNEVEAEELTDAYVETLDLYRESFGEPPAGSWVSSEGAARCRRQCAPMKCK
jgi:hypothetical protein